MPLKVALIDKNEIMQKMLSHCLHYFGADVHRFDGLEEFPAEAPFDLIFVDEDMKAGDRPLALTVRARVKQTPVVILSRNADSDGESETSGGGGLSGDKASADAGAQTGGRSGASADAGAKTSGDPDLRSFPQVKKPIDGRRIRDIAVRLAPKAQDLKIHPFLQYPEEEGGEGRSFQQQENRPTHPDHANGGPSSEPRFATAPVATAPVMTAPVATAPAPVMKASAAADKTDQKFSSGEMSGVFSPHSPEQEKADAFPTSEAETKTRVKTPSPPEETLILSKSALTPNKVGGPAVGGLSVSGPMAGGPAGGGSAVGGSMTGGSAIGGSAVGGSSIDGPMAGGPESGGSPLSGPLIGVAGGGGSGAGDHPAQKPAEAGRNPEREQESGAQAASLVAGPADNASPAAPANAVAANARAATRRGAAPPGQGGGLTDKELTQTKTVFLEQSRALKSAEASRPQRNEAETAAPADITGSGFAPAPGPDNTASAVAAARSIKQPLLKRDNLNLDENTKNDLGPAALVNADRLNDAGGAIFGAAEAGGAGGGQTLSEPLKNFVKKTVQESGPALLREAVITDNKSLIKEMLEKYSNTLEFEQNLSDALAARGEDFIKKTFSSDTENIIKRSIEAYIESAHLKKFMESALRPLIQDSLKNQMKEGGALSKDNLQALVKQALKEEIKSLLEEALKEEKGLSGKSKDP